MFINQSETTLNDFIIDDIEFDAYLEQLDDQEAESDVYADLSGDDYANAMMADLGLSADQLLFGDNF